MAWAGPPADLIIHGFLYREGVLEWIQIIVLPKIPDESFLVWFTQWLFSSKGLAIGMMLRVQPNTCVGPTLPQKCRKALPCQRFWLRTDTGNLHQSCNAAAMPRKVDSTPAGFGCVGPFLGRREGGMGWREGIPEDGAARGGGSPYPAVRLDPPPVLRPPWCVWTCAGCFAGSDPRSPNRLACGLLWGKETFVPLTCTKLLLPQLGFGSSAGQPTSLLQLGLGYPFC